MKNISKFYDNKVVKKPWGFEYVVYRDKNNLCVTLLNINFKKSTSLHCHPKKKSGFILIKGKALFQLGLWKKRSEEHSSPSKRMIARGLFHSIKSLSRDGLLALEFETPVDKKDLVRFKDPYGRQQKSYEGKKHTSVLPQKFLKFKKPQIKKKQVYEFDNLSLNIEVHKNFKKLLKNKSDTIFAIMNGSIVDKNSRQVLSVGDIIRRNDLKTLSKVFKIKKSLSVLTVLKRNYD
tara:strand:- start:236 stop:937 length:702 start_codon:yes stop_codon:yes gene_type:complete